MASSASALSCHTQYYFSSISYISWYNTPWYCTDCPILDANSK
jgi:hypothetical protein